MTGWAALRLAALLHAGLLQREDEEASPPATLEGFSRAAAPCPDGRAHCFRLDVRIVVGDGTPVVDAAWLAAAIRHANRLFEPIDVGVRAGWIRRHDPRWTSIVTREDRDLLGRSIPTEPGAIGVFVVRHLEDVDAPGEAIRGVHWRDRRETARRYVILSALGDDVVLAHELGHFFGLPHSGYRVSVMNKKEREDPPWKKRVFAEPEREKMRTKLPELLDSGELLETR